MSARKKLMESLNAKPSEPVKQEPQPAVSRRFAKDFDAVCTAYGLTPEERELAKEAARRDLDNAAVCFAAMARELA